MKGVGSWSMDGINGGTLLGARGSGFIMFWDWESGEIVRRIDVEAQNIYWSGTGSLVAITAADSFYILRFDRDAYNAKIEEGAEISDEGVEEAFEVVADVQEGSLLISYSQSTDSKMGWRLFHLHNIFQATVPTLWAASHILSVHLTRLYTSLATYPPTPRVYLGRQGCQHLGYSLSLSVVEYQTAVLRGDMAGRRTKFCQHSLRSSWNKVARFLGRPRHTRIDLKELALKVTTDPDHKFDLSLQLDDLDTAVEIARSIPELEAEAKWKSLGDRALTHGKASRKANDLSALMLLLLAIGDRDGLKALSSKAGKAKPSYQAEKGLNNLAFASMFQLGDAKSCVDLLVKTQRAPEAALFARTYAPSQVPKAVDAWQADLKAKNRPKIAASVAHPSANADLFEEGWADALAKESGSQNAVLVDAT
ncbi:coatomer WD associated region-domain-containing protein [Desarmillaria tabescens]|uniref:Coatomer WD associated region-domain-containing protein n=1 Tax=Armillaria tabescens TaxID=1929756 RepID=A0AA39MME1_ARMTA|nr:coatomer WD associated region-domain-containing protein [Desarmillaria tabescens]KAK0439263.1 coatomer WD associated region-domain-containing protein [Desarmillaria tabescens]